MLVVRAVMNTHRDSTFAQLKWAQERLGVSHLWQNTVSPMEMVYKPTGQKILFRGFDDVLKLASTTVNKGYLCFVWIEEAFEIEKEEDFEKLDLSVPRGKVPPPLFKQTTITFNPWSEKHWLKKRFFERPSKNATCYTTNYLCNEFLDNTDKMIFESMKNTNPKRYSVAGLGEWGISEGLIFENYTAEIPTIPDGQMYKWRHFFGLDYGYTNDPTAFIAIMVNPIDKLIYIYDEFYKCRMLNSDIAEEIKKKGFAKEKIRADCAEPKSNDDLRRLGISRITPSLKGADSIINGITNISEYKIYVNPKCTNTLKELSSYVWEKNPQGVRSRPVDKNNHLMDALRYAFEDVKLFHPERDKGIKATANSGITEKDINGGWN